MDDVRWFASNAYTRAVLPELRRRGLAVSAEGQGPARVVVAMSGRVAEPAWRHARAHRAALVLYLWDLPPRGTAVGRYDPIWTIGGRFLRLPRLFGGYRQRAGYYSRLRYVAVRADALWTASDLTTRIVRDRFGVDGVTLPYCYDSDRFHPGTAPRDTPPTLLTVSRLVRHKNQALVLHAAARLGGGVRVRLIGRGPEEDTLRALARLLGVRCSVETDAGDAAVELAYQTAAVVVCPSAFEGFGLSPIEAVASGTPVVASDIPPHRQYVGHVSRLVPVDDDAALAGAVEAAFGGPDPDPRSVADLTIPAAADRILTSLSPMLR